MNYELTQNGKHWGYLVLIEDSLYFIAMVHQQTLLRNAFAKTWAFPKDQITNPKRGILSILGYWMHDNFPDVELNGISPLELKRQEYKQLVASYPADLDLRYLWNLKLEAIELELTQLGEEF